MPAFNRGPLAEGPAQPGIVTRLIGGVLLTAALAIALAGCGSGTPSTSGTAGNGSTFSVQKVVPSSRLYGLEDLRNAGVKVGREYDVAGLAEAVGAARVFLNAVEYEARFYGSHEVAAAAGAAAATLVTGESAVVTGADVPWAEGATDRRKCVGAINANCVAKYWDFVVLGNMVLMCEGRDSSSALEACAALTGKLPVP